MLSKGMDIGRRDNGIPQNPTRLDNATTSTVHTLPKQKHIADNTVPLQRNNMVHMIVPCVQFENKEDEVG